MYNSKNSKDTKFFESLYFLRMPALHGRGKRYCVKPLGMILLQCSVYLSYSSDVNFSAVSWYVAINRNEDCSSSTVSIVRLVFVTVQASSSISLSSIQNGCIKGTGAMMAVAVHTLVSFIVFRQQPKIQFVPFEHLKALRDIMRTPDEITIGRFSRRDSSTIRPSFCLLLLLLMLLPW